MSYDISIRLPAVEGSEPEYVGAGWNYTRNMGYAVWEADVEARMLLGWPPRNDAPSANEHWMHAFIGKRCTDALPWFQNVLAYLNEPCHEESLRRREPSNGWGNLQSFRAAWAVLTADVAAHPEGVLEGSW